MSTYNREALKALLYSRRRNMKKGQRKKKLKPASWLYPFAIERRYAAQVRAWFRPLKDYIVQYLAENHETIMRGDSAELHTDATQELHTDATPGPSFRLMINSISGWVAKYIPDLDPGNLDKPPPQILLGLGRIADSLKDFNEGQWQKAARAALGIDFPSYEDWWPGAKKTWAEKNYTDIKSMASNYITKVNAQTEMAVTNGWSVNQLTEAILKVTKGVERTKAAFLARDQIGKLNGQTTQARMENMGLGLYLWSTCGDERVRGDPTGKYPNARPTHYEIDGALCRWDDPTVYSQDGGKTWIPRPSDWVQLHPGYDYNCRCTAMAYWDEIIGEVDAMLQEDE